MLEKEFGKPVKKKKWKMRRIKSKKKPKKQKSMSINKSYDTDKKSKFSCISNLNKENKSYI